jgi:hypothetical protein
MQNGEEQIDLEALKKDPQFQENMERLEREMRRSDPSPKATSSWTPSC